jgi:hypothetical protein
MLLEGLYTLLQSCTPLTNIVGTRIYPLVLPKNYTVPAVTFGQVSSTTEVHLDRTYVETTSVDINSWALTYSDAAKAQDAINTLLSMYQGTLSDGTVVLYTQSSTHPDEFEHDSLLYRCTTTFTIQHT